MGGAGLETILLKVTERNRLWVEGEERGPRTESSPSRVNRLGDEEEPAKETENPSNVVLGKPRKH